MGMYPLHTSTETQPPFLGHNDKRLFVMVGYVPSHTSIAYTPCVLKELMLAPLILRSSVLPII